MPLKDGYGLVIGTKSDFQRDPPDHYGRYYHGNLFVRAPAGIYHCAIDVDPQFMPDGVQWRIVKVPANEFAAIKALPDGWHPVVSDQTSGALDYIRSGALHPPPFNAGLGVHNIHQNQGDPVGGGHDTENAIWQDGGTIVETDQGDILGFLNKFKSQSFKTDYLGHPA